MPVFLQQYRYHAAEHDQQVGNAYRSEAFIPENPAVDRKQDNAHRNRCRVNNIA